MRTLLLGTLVLALACFVPGAALAATDSGAEPQEGTEGESNPPVIGEASLTTLFAQDNNFAGNSFDIVAQTDLTVVGFDVNLGVSATPWTV